MRKVVGCREVGFDCEGIIRAESEEVALAQVAEHAQAVHSLAEINDEVAQAVRAVMRDE
jgi:predicted small metal-binding protein